MEKLKIVGEAIFRKGEKVALIEHNKIRNVHDGKLLGSFDSKYVYDPEFHHLAYVSGDRLVSQDGKVETELEKIDESVEGVGQPGLKCAVYTLLVD